MRIFNGFNMRILDNNKLRILFINVLLLTGLVAFTAYAQNRKVVMPQRGLCAHRGCMDTHPENTLPAFEEAIRLGAHMIEFDIQLTKDNVMVLMHDDTVDRTTNGSGKISDLSFAQILKLDAGIKKSPKFTNTPIPTFEQTLAMMPQNVWLNCHLKGDQEVGKAAAALLLKSGRLHQAFLTCSEKASAAARQQVPGILICNGENTYRSDTPKYVQQTIKMKAGFIQLLRPVAGEDRTVQMSDLKNNHVKINYFYAKSPDELAGLFDQGVDFVLVNNLSGFLDEAKKIGIAAWQPKN
ncbi:glycerophosphodiester phosphodiesterase [Dyadobacter frigoris]|uniref:Glycerophosphodiester phosphodiesterase n=2 Tax=Dyadobacter frigoris TaxID=2576211 RepID=A0A4U6CVD0_9BACT|nr:glycerophosphodiester phosphodiesterase [Dyadobacter frigoris]